MHAAGGADAMGAAVALHGGLGDRLLAMARGDVEPALESAIAERHVRFLVDDARERRMRGCMNACVCHHMTYEVADKAWEVHSVSASYGAALVTRYSCATRFLCCGVEVRGNEKRDVTGIRDTMSRLHAGRRHRVA